MSGSVHHNNTGIPFDPRRIGPMPAGYIPGISRGDQGFITRSDIGPMKADFPTGLGASKQEGGGDDAQNDTKWDSWLGYNEAPQVTMNYDDEDREADDIYNTIDNYLETKKTKKYQKETEKVRNRLTATTESMKMEDKSNSEMLINFKRQQQTMSKDDWDSIPDAVSYGNKRNRRAEKYTPVPDRVIMEGINSMQPKNVIDPKALEATNPNLMKQSGLASSLLTGGMSKVGGMSTVMAGMTSQSDVGEAREKLLGQKLDSISSTVSGQSVVDSSGMLTALNTVDVTKNVDISDLKKARLLFKSLINSNPKKARGWIAAARVEELDGKVQEAKNILAQGVEHAPYSEDLWLEAARFEGQSDLAKSILAKGVKHIPKSIKLWIACAKKETETEFKVKVLKKALKIIPQSEKIWRMLIELSMKEDEAKEYLSCAVKCTPDCLDFWIAFAKLSPYLEAKAILNEAGNHFKKIERKIWIHAAKLEESNGNPNNCDTLIQRGLKKISKAMMIRREDWLEEAYLCEKHDTPGTAKAIIRSIFQLDMVDKDFEKQWIEDSDAAILRSNNACAKSMLEFALQNCPDVKELWYKAISFERMHGSQEGLDELLSLAVRTHPDSAEFWMRLAKCFIIRSDIETARATLIKAQETCKNQEAIYFARVHLEKECNNLESAREIIMEARGNLPESEDCWLESIKLERQFGKHNESLKIAKEATKKLPNSIKITLELANIFEGLSMPNDAKKILEKSTSTKAGKVDTSLWIKLILLEEKYVGVKKARAVYENCKSRLNFMKNAELWIQIIRMEQRVDNNEAVKSMVTLALKECPNNGELWSISIELELKSRRKAKSIDALQKCDDVYVILSVMKLFWSERKMEKTRSWLERAVQLSPDIGDSWAYYLKFIELQCENEGRGNLISRMKNAEPSEGRMWKSITDIPENWRMSPEDVLLQVAEMVDIELEKYSN